MTAPLSKDDASSDAVYLKWDVVMSKLETYPLSEWFKITTFISETVKIAHIHYHLHAGSDLETF